MCSSIIHSFNFFLNFSPNLSSTLSSTSLLNSSATISKFSFLEQARYLDYSGERSLPGLFRRAFILKSCYLDYSGEHSLPGFLQASFPILSRYLDYPGEYSYFWWLNPSFLTITFLMFSSVSSLLFPSSEKDSGQSLKPRHYKFP